MLYDAADRLVATRGTLFSPGRGNRDKRHVWFFRKIVDKETGYSYFQVEMPVYNRGYRKL